MNSDCLSYVMICLCIGVAYDCVSGSGEQTERDTLTHRDTQNQVKHRREKYFLVLLIFFFLSQCIFILGGGDRQRAHNISSPM